MTQQTVLITGANRGIGFGLCQYYLRQGYKVIAGCRTPDALTAKLPNEDKLLCLELDQSSNSSITALANNIQRHALTLDIVINNAGITANEPFGNWSQQSFLDSFNINSIGPTLITQAIAPLLNESAKVIQISSGLASIEGSNKDVEQLTSYSMSKAALNMATAKLAVILKARNIIVAAISPGWVQTDMGGAEAPDTVEQAVTKLSATINGLRIQDSGKFFGEEGQHLAW